MYFPDVPDLVKDTLALYVPPLMTVSGLTIFAAFCMVLKGALIVPELLSLPEEIHSRWPQLLTSHKNTNKTIVTFTK
jgi:hypothetical protein